METVIAQIKRTIFQKPDTRWGIWDTDLGTCKGVIDFDVADGDRLRLLGQWETSKYNGKRELNFAHAYPDVPEDLRTLLHYACSITIGIGDSMEEKIWEAYDKDWRSDPTLEKISGLRSTARFNWGETLKRLETHAIQAKTISWLMEHGATLNMANAAWKAWQADTIKSVSADPYVLASLPHYGFRDIDESIRRQLGIGDSDPRRMRAAIMYAIQQVRGQGDTVAPIDSLRERIEKICPIQTLKFDSVFETMIQDGIVSLVEDAENVQILVCLTADMDVERKIGDHFDAMG